jgi:hypothetical protein
MPNPYCCTDLLCWKAPRKACQTAAVRTELYGPFCSNKHSKQPRFLSPQYASENMTSSLLYRLYGSIQYSLPNSNKFQPLLNRKSPWKMCPISLGKCTQLADLSSPQSSLNVLFSLLYLAHYPMHSLIIRK